MRNDSVIVLLHNYNMFQVAPHFTCHVSANHGFNSPHVYFTVRFKITLPKMNKSNLLCSKNHVSWIQMNMNHFRW